jgi:hypothetical protein
MKRKILVLLGIATIANAAFGAGGNIYFDNYNQGTYNQVIWGFGPNAGQAVFAPIMLQLYYAEGTGYTSLSQLTPGITTPIDMARNYVYTAGQGGWFDGGIQNLPTWQVGDVFTFCVVVIEPGYSGQSSFWTETGAAIRPDSFPPLPPSGFLNFPGLTVTPEPSTFGLAGIGGAVLAAFRRRSMRRV